MVLVLAAAAAGLWWLLGTLDSEAPPEPLLPQRSAQSLLALDPAAIERITVHQPRSNALVRLERADDGGWRISEPVQDWAEPVAVYSAMSALLAQDWSEAPSEWSAQDAAGLGLDPAEIAVAVRDASGREQLLRVGALDFAGRWRAAELDGRRIRVGEGIVSPLVRDVDSWRDLRLQPLAPPAVTLLRWEPDAGPTLELARGDAGWRILAPFAAPLDERAAPFVERLLGARALQIRRGTLAQEPLVGALLGTLTVRGAQSSFRLDLHEDGLRASHRDFAMAWSSEDFAILFRDPEALRSPRLLALDPGRIVTIRVERGGDAGVFRRAAGGWSLQGRGPLAAEEAAFLDALLEHGARLEGSEWRELPESPPSGRVIYAISRTPRDGAPTLLWWTAADGTQLVAAAGAPRATTTAINFDLAVRELFARLAAQ